MRFIRTPISFWHRTSEASGRRYYCRRVGQHDLEPAGDESFYDLGTNGELAFGNSDFMVSCACSAGPAFEGGDISCGMRATDGAIEKCTIDPETMEPSYHVIGDEGTKPIGLCGSGIIDVIAALFRAKMVNPKGKIYPGRQTDPPRQIWHGKLCHRL